MEAIGTSQSESPPRASAVPCASPPLELPPLAPEGQQDTTAYDLESEEDGSSQLPSAPSLDDTMTYFLIFGGRGHMVPFEPRPSESVQEEMLIYLHGWCWTGQRTC